MLRAAKSSILLRVVSLACTLVQVRLTMPYLGEERFGFWTVLMAIGGFFGISDLGVSSAFQNDVTNAEARGESSRLRAMFLTAQATLLLLALTGALVVIAVVAVVGKATFFRNLSPELAGQAVTLTAVFVLGGTLNAPLALAGRLAFGMHLGHLANFTVLVAQLLTLIAMVGAAMLRAPFAVFLLATIIPSLCCNLALGMRLLARLEPSPRNWEGAAYAKHTIRSGVQFLALGASLPLFFAMGPLLLSTAFDAGVVTAYGLATRALGVVHNLEAGVLGATWPVITESLGHGDHARARRCVRRSVLLTCGAFCLPSLLFPLLGPRVLSLWSGLPVASFPGWIVWPVTLLYVAVMFQGPFYIALSAAGSVTILAVSHCLAAVAAFAAVTLLRGSPQTIPACMAVAFAVFAVLPAILQTRRIFHPATTGR